jgi:hypothetical protein
VFWETSGDGSAWTVQHQAAPPIAIDALRVVLGAGYEGTIAVEFTAALDNLNLIP